MKATEKQLKYIQTLAKRTKAYISGLDSKQLTKGAASEIIDKLLNELAEKNSKADDVKEVAISNHEIKETEVNEPRFGMCFKIVVSRYDTGTLVRNTADIIEDIIAMYQLAGNAHNAIETLISGVEE